MVSLWALVQELCDKSKRVDRFVAEGEVDKAVDLARKLRGTPGVFRVYMAVKQYEEASKLALNNPGDRLLETDKQEALDLIIPSLEKVENYTMASSVAERIGAHDICASMLAKSGNTEAGVKYALEHDLPVLGIQIYLKAEQIHNAAELAVKTEKYALAVQIFKENGRIGEAIDIAEKYSLDKEARELHILNFEEFVRGKRLIDGIDYGIQHGLTENLIRLCDNVLLPEGNASLCERIALFLLQAEQTGEANRLYRIIIGRYRDSKQYDYARRNAVSAGFTEMIEELYADELRHLKDKGSNSLTWIAQKAAEELGPDKTIAILLQIQEPDVAADTAMQHGRHERAVQIFADDKRYERAAITARKSGLDQLADQWYTQVSRDHEAEGELYLAGVAAANARDKKKAIGLFIHAADKFLAEQPPEFASAQHTVRMAANQYAQTAPDITEAMARKDMDMYIKVKGLKREQAIDAMRGYYANIFDVSKLR